MGRYVALAVKELPSLCPDCTFYLLLDRNHRSVGESLKKSSLQIKIVFSYFGDFILDEQISVPYLAAKLKADVVWCPYNTFPLFGVSGSKLVVTVNDLIFMGGFRFLDIRKSVGFFYRRLVLGRLKGIGASVMTISNFSRSEISRLLSIGNVAVAPVCIEKRSGQTTERETLALPSEFIFTVSGDSPSKNLDFLIQTVLGIADGLPLVIAGVHNIDSPLRRRYRNMEKIQFLGTLDRDSLDEVYHRAKFFVFPSLEEGFGIPLLEAMTFGLPIACSDRTSMPEVLGNAGVYFDPTDQASLAALLRDPSRLDFPHRRDFLEAQLAKYNNWQDTARIIMTILRKRPNEC